MKIEKTSKIKAYVLSILIALAAGGISAVFAMGAMEEYSKLKQPPLAPPSWLFPVVWTILFVLMGISAARVYLKGSPQTKPALASYAVQLIINIIWTPLYFTLNLRLAAFIWLIALFIAVIVMIVRFSKVDTVSAWLQLPYVLWIIFAGYLNLSTYLLNG